MRLPAGHAILGFTKVLQDGGFSVLELIINPVAGNGRAVRIAQRIEQALQARGIAYRAQTSQRPGHAIELARACAAAGTERVLCVGGDGTAYEVINGLKGTRTALGIIPAGTGNDFVKTLHLPKDPVDTLHLLLEAPACPINVCAINDGIFLNECGAGFDVEVLRGAAKAGWLGQGMLPYLFGVLRAVFRPRPLHLRVTIDGQVSEQTLLLIAIANGQYIGGGMRIAPMARLDDDLLDVILVQMVPRRRIVRLMPAFISGKYVRETDIVTHLRCKTIEIEGHDLYVQTDGLVQQMDRASMAVSPERQWILLPEAQQRLANMSAGE